MTRIKHEYATDKNQFDGKHIGLIPGLKFRGLLLMTWLGRCHEKGTVIMQKCGDSPCTCGANFARISAAWIMVSILIRKEGTDPIK